MSVDFQHFKYLEVIKIEVKIEPIIKLIKEAGTLFKPPHDVATKGPADFVSEIDISVQEFIYKQLNKWYPKIQFLGEENNQHHANLQELCWVLDPVDGTTNLIHDYRFSAISLALIKNYEPILGIIYQPYTKELFYASKDNGAYLNGQRIHVSQETQLKNSLIAIGTSPYYRSEADDNFELFKTIYKNCVDIRRSGSASLDLAWCACGRLEAYLERKLKIWDYAAGMIIIKEAGGLVVDYQGQPLEPKIISDVVAGNQEIVMKLVNDFITKKKS